MSRRWFGRTWFRVDLVFSHGRLKCPVTIDLKAGRLTMRMPGRCTSI
ncbi:hypothetical protein [Paraburkholderia rhynchosiae]|nr:hypothetical protein [Paraburkholderia rhynchosiae]